MREKCVLEFFAAACAWIERFYQQGMDISMKLIRKKKSLLKSIKNF